MKIHFIGCLGASMKFLMHLCRSCGIEVSGSDESAGGHDARNIIGADAVVYSLAIPAENPERKEAERRKIAVFSRAEFLGEVAKGYEKVIAVAGTHGKTTTTAMLWEIFDHLYPTVHLGGEYNNRNGCIGQKKIFITEACEYRGAFLKLHPDVAIILNVAHDHVDCYPRQEDVNRAFFEFEKNSKLAFKNLSLCCNYNNTYIKNDDNKGGRLRNLPKYYGEITGKKNGCYSFDFFCQGERVGEISLSVTGFHNAENALYATAVAYDYGVAFWRIQQGLSRFMGVSRRQEYLGEKNGVAVYSDYAHHPDEITATYFAIKGIGYKKIAVIFEPHTYSRTKAFFLQIISSLSAFDDVTILPVFSAREIGSNEIAQELSWGISHKTVCRYLGTIEGVDESISKSVEKSECEAVVFMGAGKVGGLAKKYIDKPTKSILAKSTNKH